jgi:uncharacterized membrane protein
MMDRLRAFGAFWYDFVIGDDWRVAAGVICALFITWAVSTSTVAAWWITPALFALVLPYSLLRAVSQRKG